jgi:negative regulator of flagellin synthesis FlgM
VSPVKVNGTGGIDPIKAYTAQINNKTAEAKTKTGGKVCSDTLEISTEARKMQNYKVKLAEIPAVREELVASLKQRIQEGSYQPDVEKIAAGLLEEIHLDKGK